MKETDIAIIGAGPVGLFAGFYAGMRGMSSSIIDKLDVPGGRLTALYPEKYIYDIAGIPKIKAQQLIDDLMEQLNRFESSTELVLGSEVKNIEKIDDGYNIVFDDKVLKVKAIIIALGNGAFSPRKLGLDKENSFTNIHYSIPDMQKFKGKKVALFGGGDSAVDWALMLNEIANEVNIIHRRDEFRAHDHSVEVLKESTVNIYTPFTPLELKGKDKTLTSVIIKDKNGDEKEIFVDDVIVNFGFTASLGPVEQWGLEIEKNKIVVNSEQKTNLENIYAVGDICTYPGKSEIITTGFGECPVAINGIYKTLNPNARVGALHSSSVIKE